MNYGLVGTSGIARDTDVTLVFCGFLHPPIKCLNFHEKWRICKISGFLRKIFVLGSLCHLMSVTLSSPRKPLWPKFYFLGSLIGNGNSARSFSDPEVFSWTSTRDVRSKMPVFPGFGGPDRSFWPDVRKDIRPKTSSLG